MIVAVSVYGQPLESVTETVYVPTVRPLIVPVVAPLLHTNAYGGVPPCAFAVSEPVAAPLHGIC